MKKILSLALASTLTLSLAACGGAPAEESTAPSEAPATESTAPATESTAPDAESTAPEASGDTVTVTATDAAGNPIDVEFPTNAERIVVLNYQTMDFLEAVGMEDKVVGFIKDGAPEHLMKYEEDESIVDVGGMKDPDMEAIMSLEPDIIFTSDRIEDMYEEFSMIAPTYCAYVDYSIGFMEGYKILADEHAAIFGVGDEVDATIAGYEERISAIADFAGEQTALLGIFAGGLNTLGNTGRCSIVVNEMGFENLAGDENVNHGNISSYEAWLEMNPDWMFIIDKDTAVGTEAVAAKEQMEVNNPVIAETDAFKNGQIVYLEPSSAWYLADGGILAMDMMISCVEEGIGLK